MSRARHTEGPLDQALQRLRDHGLPYRWSEHDLKIWESPCPSCLAPEYGLIIREPFRAGPITLRCIGGCPDPDVRAALELDPTDRRIAEAEQRLAAALDLATQARDLAARALELTLPTPGLKAAA